MTDHSLKQDVLDQLEFEPSIDANNIGVTVEDAIVTLTGHVSSYAQKLATERTVARVKGVKGIALKIEVRFSEGTADDEIAKTAVDMLRWSTAVPDDRVRVTVEGGWVTLTGTLDWEYQRKGAEAALRHLKGVKGISNRIELKPRVLAKDVTARIESALKRSGVVEAKHIRVSVDGNHVLLEGNVRAWDERRVAERAAWSVPGVTGVDDRLTVS
jgi:osmotically-inducible protein OsmY